MQRVWDLGLLDQYLCNYTYINLMLVWAVFGGIRLVDQPRALAAKIIHFWVSFNIPQSANKRLLEARKSRKIRESRKNRKIESRCEAKGLPFCTCNLMGWQIVSVLWALIGFGTAVVDAPLASKEAPASKNGTAVKSATVEMTKAEDGPPEKVWTSLSFKSMIDKEKHGNPTEKHSKSMISRRKVLNMMSLGWFQPFYIFIFILFCPSLHCMSWELAWRSRPKSLHSWPQLQMP